MIEVRTFVNERELVESVTELIVSRILEGIDSRGSFHLALTGGGTGTQISEYLISKWNDEPAQYIGLHLWWGDERYLPEGDLQRNSAIVLERLHPNSGIHLHPVLTSDSNVGLGAAAKRYSSDLAGIDMDLILLGVGPDGHVASLFPGKWDANEHQAAIAVHDSPKPPPMRVSFSMEKINSASSVWLLAAGSSKRRAVAQIISHDLSVPAAWVQGQHQTWLFVDSSAQVDD